MNNNWIKNEIRRVIKEDDAQAQVMQNNPIQELQGYVQYLQNAIQQLQNADPKQAQQYIQQQKQNLAMQTVADMFGVDVTTLSNTLMQQAGQNANQQQPMQTTEQPVQSPVQPTNNADMSNVQWNDADDMADNDYPMPTMTEQKALTPQQQAVRQKAQALGKKCFGGQNNGSQAQQKPQQKQYTPAQKDSIRNRAQAMAKRCFGNNNNANSQTAQNSNQTAEQYIQQQLTQFGF